MALAALFAKTVTEAAEGMDEADAAADEKHAAERTKSTMAFRSFGTLPTPHLDRLPSEKRIALEAATKSTSIMLVAGQEKGPGHFRLSKRGTGRRFDVTLGDPCRCLDRGRPVGEGEALILTYWVLTRLLHTGPTDEALEAVPRLPARTVDRLLAQAAVVRKRALQPPKIKGQLTEAEIAAALGGGGGDGGRGGGGGGGGAPRRKRSGGGGGGGGDPRDSYELDPLVEPGEPNVDFAATLGDTEAVPPPRMPPPRQGARAGRGFDDGTMGQRVHPRISHFGGMPPITLGGGNRLAAMGSRGAAMVPIDTMPQVSALCSCACVFPSHLLPPSIENQSTLLSSAASALQQHLK